MHSGKDKVVKYWDADKFEHLLTLEGHHGEVWCMALSAHGDFLVTGSHDRSLRRWERTDEPFFVEEEREKRLESLFEADLEVWLSIASSHSECSPCSCQAVCSSECPAADLCKHKAVLRWQMLRESLCFAVCACCIQPEAQQLQCGS